MNHASQASARKALPDTYLRLVTAALLTLVLVACSPKEEPPTLGQKLDAAISKTEKAADEAREKTEDAVDAARERLGQVAEDVKASTAETGAMLSEKTEGAVDSARERLGQAAEDVKASTAETGAALSEKAEDAAITAAIAARLVGDRELSALKIDVDTRDGKVTLNGEAPSEAARARAAELATSVKGVQGIENRLVVK